MKINGILSTEDFIKSIEKLSREKNIEYIDAILHYCETNNLELETAGAIIKSNVLMKSKLQEEAEKLNFLPKRNKLPI